MNYEKKLIGLCVLISISCLPDQSDRLKGHWHAIPDKNNYLTLDIDDTVTITDKYSLCGMHYVENNRKSKNGKEILPSSIYESSSTFEVKGDTLIVQDSSSAFIYIRKKISECILEDRYRDCYIKGTLLSYSPSIDWKIGYKRFCSTNLFIGFPNTETKSGSRLRNTFPDSVVIEYQSVLISLNDFPRFYQEIKDMCFDDNRPLNMNLHIDSNVPESFVKKIESLTPQEFLIHRVVISETGDIGLKQIR